MPLSPEQIADIEAARATPRLTLRAVSEGMETHLYKAYPVLDHGLVRVIDYMGDDAAIVQAARVSYGAGTKHVQNDEGLIRYLMRHWHSTPFEMCEIKLHVKLPIFVARQWIRHRTANVNEYSARYSVMDREFYIPEPQHLAAPLQRRAVGMQALHLRAWAREQGFRRQPFGGIAVCRHRITCAPGWGCPAGPAPV